MNSISIEDLAIGYGKKVVARHLTTVIRGGEFTCLIGRNGLGKSTLLRTLAGFILPLSGKVSITADNNYSAAVDSHPAADTVISTKNYDLCKVSKMDLSRLVSVVLTDRVDLSNISARDVVAMGRMPYTGFFGNLSDDDDAIVEKAIRLTVIQPLASRDFSTLSDGERQKVMIARALAQQTPVMLLDEPTAFLDYESKVETMLLLASLAHKSGSAILASTHDLDIAVRTADRLVTIDQGMRDCDKQQLRDSILSISQ